MRTFRKEERFPSRAARDRNDAAPLLTVDEQLEGVALDLIQPVEVNGANADSIIITTPTVEDILAVQRNTGDEGEIIGLTRCTPLTADAIRSMHVRDFTRLRELYWGFTE